MNALIWIGVCLIAFPGFTCVHGGDLDVYSGHHSHTHEASRGVQGHYREGTLTSQGAHLSGAGSPFTGLCLTATAAAVDRSTELAAGSGG